MSIGAKNPRLCRNLRLANPQVKLDLGWNFFMVVNCRMLLENPSNKITPKSS